MRAVRGLLPARQAGIRNLEADQAQRFATPGARNVERGPRAVLPAVAENAGRRKHERGEHDLYLSLRRSMNSRIVMVIG